MKPSVKVTSVEGNLRQKELKDAKDAKDTKDTKDTKEQDDHDRPLCFHFVTGSPLLSSFSASWRYVASSRGNSTG
jgi:hypothetical protein